MRRAITSALAAVFLSGCASSRPMLGADGAMSVLTSPGRTIPATSTAPATSPPGYVIGAEDVLNVIFWRDAEVSGEVVVRPDGKISLPLLNDVQAAGYTPDELRLRITEAASAVMEDPSVTVIVKAINSRRVFITGNVSQPGTHQLTSGMTVLQLIAMAGGLGEYADTEKILIVRPESGGTRYFKFNYKDVIDQNNLQQNIMLRPGDTVVVP